MDTFSSKLELDGKADPRQIVFSSNEIFVNFTSFPIPILDNKYEIEVLCHIREFSVLNKLKLQLYEQRVFFIEQLFSTCLKN